jgi:hypothetical protein
MNAIIHDGETLVECTEDEITSFTCCHVRNGSQYHHTVPMLMEFCMEGVDFNTAEGRACMEFALRKIQDFEEKLNA